MASTVIKALSALPALAVKEYLIRQGNDTEPILEWKYFDPLASRGGERGFACIHDGQMTAFVGLVPFQVSDSGVRIETAWSCDWYRDPGSGGPMGIMLLKRSLASYGRLYSLGGSENTRAILPRLSQTVVLDAAIELHKPLRVGGVIRAIARTAHLRRIPRVALIDDVPLQRVGRIASPSKARLSSTLSSSIETLLEASRDYDPQSCYGIAYFNWQLMRCPVLVSGVCTVPGDATPRAAVFFWRTVQSSAFWRIALVHEPRAQEEIHLALTRVIQYVQAQGGWMISVVVSRLEKDVLGLLAQKGFIAARGRRPLFIMDNKSELPPRELQKLSYLDTDYAYRFSL